MPRFGELDTMCTARTSQIFVDTDTFYAKDYKYVFPAPGPMWSNYTGGFAAKCDPKN